MKEIPRIEKNGELWMDVNGREVWLHQYDYTLRFVAGFYLEVSGRYDFYGDGHYQSFRVEFDPRDGRALVAL